MIRVKLSLLTAFAFFTFFSSSAQNTINSGSVTTQNFNSMGTSATASLPGGWRASVAGGGAAATWASASITSTTQAAHSGSPTTAGFYNWGMSSDPGDRAPGFMTNGYASPNAILAEYTNSTGGTLTSTTISFLIERYRINGTAFTLNFYSSTDGSTWTAQAAGDVGAGEFPTGADSYSFGVPGTVTKTVTINGLNIANGGNIYFRWVFNTSSPNSQGLGLDQVAVSSGHTTLAATLSSTITSDAPPTGAPNPGDVIAYTTTITNTGSEPARNVQLNQPAPNNTTFNPGSLITSALANDDNFITPQNTVLTGTTVLVNDYGVPAVSLVSYGPTLGGAVVLPGGAAATAQGGQVNMNANGTFTYTPPNAGFIGYDEFYYIASTVPSGGLLPTNDARVIIDVGDFPVAATDAYNVIGNIYIQPNAAQGVLANDAGNGTVTPINSGATAQGGTVTLSSDGSFTYNPPAGYEGDDNFNYTVTNALGSATGTVSVTVSGMVWFINNNGGSGDGRLTSPFNSISAFQSINNGAGNNPASNDNVFIYESVTDYNGTFTLLTGQKLIGQDASGTLASIAGVSPQAYSAPLPVLNNGNATIVNLVTTAAATNAVNLNSAAGSNLLRGFTVGNTTGSAVSGTGFGTLTMLQVSKNGTGQALALTNGTFAAGASLDNVTTTSSVNALSLTSMTGSLSVVSGSVTGATGAALVVSGGTMGLTYSGDITQANNAPIFNIGGGHNTGIILFQTGTLSATNGTGLQFDNADGVYGFNGTVNLNGGDAGIDILNGSGGTFNFAVVTGSISITNPTGVAFNVVGPTGSITYDGNITQANNAAMVSVSGGHTGTLTFSAGNTLTATNGTGLQFDNADGSYNFNGTTVLNGGDAGIDIMNGSGGTFFFSSGTSITSPTGIAFNISGTASTAGVTYHGNITHATNTAMVNVAGGHNTGALLFQTGTLQATNGTGLQFDNADGTYNFVSTTTLNGGDAGIDILNGSGGTFNFATTGGSIAITNPSGNAFNIGGTSNSCTVTYNGDITKNNAGSMVSIVNHASGTITFSTGHTLSATTASAGNGLQFSDADGTYNFNGTTTLNGGDAGIDILGGSAGTFNFQSGTAITNPSGIAINVDNSPGGNISYFGSFSKTNTGIGIQVNNKTGGSFIVNSALTKTLSTSTSTAINLTNNTGGTINFAGNNLSITTTNGIGFNATGGGTVNVSGTGNIISSGSGTALNVANTTIGGSGLTFQSISANGGANGIVLNNTGTNAGLTITGSGGLNSGGTIQNMSGSGIVATSTNSLSLTRVLISNLMLHGIEATNVTGNWLLANSTIQEFGLLATATHSGVFLVNNNVNLTLITVSNSTFNGNNASDGGFFMEAQGTSSMAAHVNNTLFTDIFGDGFEVQSITGSSGTVSVTVENSTFTNAANLGNGGIQMDPFGGATFKARILNNNLNDIMRPTTTLGSIGMTTGLTVNSDVTIKGNILNNIIGARGITFTGDGNSTSRILVDDNDIDRLGSTSKYAISMNLAPAVGNFPTLDVTVSNNNVGQGGSNLWTTGNGTAEAIFFLTQNSGVMKTMVNNNVVTANATLEVIRARAIHTSTQNITYSNNTVTDNFSTHVGELAAITVNTATLCMNASGNVLPGGGVGVILLTVTGGPMNITQASAGALSAANSGATVTVSGAPTYGQPACATPSLPVH